MFRQTECRDTTHTQRFVGLVFLVDVEFTREKVPVYKILDAVIFKTDGNEADAMGIQLRFDIAQLLCP